MHTILSGVGLASKPKSPLKEPLITNQDKQENRTSTLPIWSGKPDIAPMVTTWDIVSSKIEHLRLHESQSIDITLLRELFISWTRTLSFVSDNITVQVNDKPNKLKLAIQVEGQAFYYGKKIDSQLTCEGMYEPGTKDICQGNVRFLNGTILKGTFARNPNLNKRTLVEGSKIFPSGIIFEGKFGYDPNLNEIILVNGKKILPNKIILEGEFKYSLSTKTMTLVGEISVGGIHQRGTFHHDSMFNLVSPELLSTESLVLGR